MGFYDNYNFDGCKLFSNLKKGHMTGPCWKFLSIIRQFKSTTPPNH